VVVGDGGGGSMGFPEPIVVAAFMYVGGASPMSVLG
jgi:hypothetical protein